MDISHTRAIERVARVLAAQRLSANAEGAEPSASRSVDATWPNFASDAVAILKTLREPDAAMAAAGDIGTWAAMISAALGEQDSADIGDKTLIAVLDDVDDGLRLTLRYGGGEAGSEAQLPCAHQVADLAEANREIDIALHARPGHSVVRAGDGWVTHPE